MDTKLGKFEGHQVEASQLSLSAAKTTQFGKARDGEVVYFIGMAAVDDIGHGLLKIGQGKLYTRKHTAGVSRLVVLQPGDGARMLDEAIMLADEQFGVANLFNQPDDGDGNVSPLHPEGDGDDDGDIPE